MDLSKSQLGKRKTRSVAVELPTLQSNPTSAPQQDQEETGGMESLHLTDPTKQVEG